MHLFLPPSVSVTDCYDLYVVAYRPGGKILATSPVDEGVFVTSVVNVLAVTDSGLVARAKEGDEEAFSTLLRPAIAAAYRLAGGMLHDAHAAEDIVQESSLKAWRKIRQLKEGAELRPWFLGIVANECRSARRARWWSVIKLADPESHRVPAEDSVAAFADLRRAIRRLNHRRRLLLVLHWYLDLPILEIAAVTRSTEDAVKSELARAIRQLRGLLGGREGQ